MSNTESNPDSLKIVVDGVEIDAKPGELIISAAERNGVFIPRFCYHPRMSSVGVCRMCLVDVKGPRGFSLAPSCYLTVAPGMEVITNSDKVKKAQDGVLEFLLVNHPLDCPVCDKGGECPLQDQTLAYGPGESRFVEEKRHFEKPIALSEIVYLDRERCIQCDRCVRFASEIAFDPLIEFIGRGDHTEVNTFPDSPFASYFSGNTVQICPVGALTAKPYRFKARPWDLEQSESTCTTCSVGCRIAIQTSRSEVTRYLGIDSDAVNHSWLCDRGRFGYEATNSSERLSEPYVRYRSDLAAVSWRDAIGKVGSILRGAISQDPANVAFIGGSSLTNEGIYSFVRLAKSGLSVENFDARVMPSRSADVLFSLPRVSLNEAMASSIVVVIGADPREEMPVLFLRMGEASKTKTEIYELSRVETSISTFSKHIGVSQIDLLRQLREGNFGTNTSLESLFDRLATVDKVTFVIGDETIANASVITDELALALHEKVPNAGFLFMMSDANIFGAYDLGAIPGYGPGRVALGTNGDSNIGIDIYSILRRACDQDMVLVILAEDLITKMADTALVEAALSRSTVIVIDSYLTATGKYAEAILPLVAPGETAGTHTNFEGRVSRLGKAVVPMGQAKTDVVIAAEIAREMMIEATSHDHEDIFNEMVATCALYSGLSYSELGSERSPDGVIVPLPRTKVAIGRRRSLDPIATPGLVSSGRQGPPANIDEAVDNGPSDYVGRFTQASFARQSDKVDLVDHQQHGEYLLVLTRPLYYPTPDLVVSPVMKALIPSSQVRVPSTLADSLGLIDGQEVELSNGQMGILRVPALIDKTLPDDIVVGTLGSGVNLLSIVDSSKEVNYVKVGIN